MTDRWRKDFSQLSAEIREALGVREERRRVREGTEIGDEERRWLGALERDGFALIPSYLPRERCEALRSELDALLVHYEKRAQRDAAGADERLLAVDRVSARFRAFWDDPVLRRIRQAWCGSTRQVGFTMANRIRATAGNRGSGSGWHRDSVGGRRLKAIVYLCDVSPANGPFQYWRGSHRLHRRLQAGLRTSTPLAERRFESAEQEHFLESRADVSTLAAPVGSLILADTTGLHRGRALESGTRYAMTNYYFESGIPEGWPLLDEDTRER